MAYFWIFGSMAAALTLAADVAFRKERAEREAMENVTRWVAEKERLMKELTRQRSRRVPELVLELGVHRAA